MSDESIDESGDEFRELVRQAAADVDRLIGCGALFEDERYAAIGLMVWGRSGR